MSRKTISEFIQRLAAGEILSVWEWKILREEIDHEILTHSAVALSPHMQCNNHWSNDKCVGILSEPEAANLSRALMALQPALSNDKAIAISELLFAYSPRPWISAAILMQESSLLDVHVYKTGYNVQTHKMERVLFDMGIAQINAATATTYRCDVELLARHDLREAIRCHSLVLRDKLSICHALGSSAYRCYNSLTPKFGIAYESSCKKWIRILESYRFVSKPCRNAKRCS